MKTATIPSLRVAPELRKAAERVLRKGESLSSFVEQSLKAQVNQRVAQQQFIARGMASRDAAHRSGDYVPADKVLREMDRMLAAAKGRAKGKR